MGANEMIGKGVHEVSQVMGRRSRLAQRRRMAGYTQDSLAEYVDVALSSVKRWEGGRTTPQPALRRRLANALDVTLDELDELLTHTDELSEGTGTTSDGAAGIDDASWAPASGDDVDVTDNGPLLAYAAKLASTEPQPLWPQADDPTSLLQQPVVTDDTILAMRRVTAALRAIDIRYGGGACRAAAAAHLSWALPLLDRAPSLLRRPLSAAVAEVHALIGWTAMDVGARGHARRHMLAALELAQHSRDRVLMAEILYRMARLLLHGGQPKDALQLLQLGQVTADESGSPLAVTVLWGNLAWTYAELGDAVEMQLALDRATDSYARTDLATEQWFKFFTPADLDALRGVALSTLAAVHRDRADPAVTALRRSVDGRTHDKARSLAFELIAMAAAHLYAGDIVLGVATGHEAVDLALRVRSTRVVDRFTRLVDAAAERRRCDGVGDLLARIAELGS